MEYLHYIKTHPNFPKPGILFYDLAPLFYDAKVLSHLIQDLATRVKDLEFDLIAGVESRGFIFGSILAFYCQRGFVMIRKPGKLPGKLEEIHCKLEYGETDLSLQHGSIQPGQKILLVDDVLATGGTAFAATQLIKRIGAEVSGCLFTLEIESLQGRALLAEFPVEALISL
ncbi:MAG: adenine phosphoribosyltransferase [Gammaproteobacteria bacterium]|jgi:adenine phosphoribosyltransferase|nr:adenine phosphoribosyltransferase [Gammaproteobacteria bacterium]